jgi:NAD-dependent deacetylase sirtuin 2
MCGAGISTSAGIPDFRTPGTGLYSNLQRFDLPTPESVFALDFFRDNPAAFYELAKELWPGNYQPTPTHYFIRLLNAKGILLRCYSQNIDSLETQAGVPANRVVAAHGNFEGAHVIDTDPRVEVDINELKAALDQGVEGWKALAKEKGGLVKPSITFFGEPLPRSFVENSTSDLSSCDLLIVLGTSLVVHPFAGLVRDVVGSVPRLLINRDAAGTCDKLEKGFRFHKEGADNWRDVFHQGDCDSGCRALAKAMDWEADLDALIATKGACNLARASWVDKDYEMA